MNRCQHQTLRFEESAHAQDVGYVRSSPAARQAACLSSNETPLKIPSPSTFPAPLILPGDELALDPSYPPQTVQDTYYHSKASRNIVYVLRTPAVAPELFNVMPPRRLSTRNAPIPPRTERVVEYLAAFYSPMTVKYWNPGSYQFCTWSDDGISSKVKEIGLQVDSSVTRIRMRSSPDGRFLHQLNLSDLLDTAISILPKDAYALLMVVDNDLYEDDEDDFCCGRAFGGSRVAVVSNARYNPQLDNIQGVDVKHSWPASHCEAYINSLLGSARKRAGARLSNSPMNLALQAYPVSPGLNSPLDKQRLWLARVCKTASHELGHCFGIDHCVYYACIMQGTASIAEDARQPPYLCPVDLAKILKTTASTEKQWLIEMKNVCVKLAGGEKGMFDAFAAWIEGRLQEVV